LQQFGRQRGLPHVEICWRKMTTYLYSDIPYGTDAGSYAFDEAADVLDINSFDLSAAEVTLSDLPDGSGVEFYGGGKRFVLVGATVSDLNQDNVVFADGSMLVNSCEANDYATDLSGTAFDDLLLGSAPGQAPSGWTLRGGAGNDVYQVSTASDHIVEAVNQGTDTVRSSAIAYTLAANVERLILTGTAAISGTGNALSNELIGNAGNNVLDGGAGQDTMRGGYGDDTYYANAHTSGNTTYLDAVIEGLNQGHDTMLVSVEYSLLPENIEDLVLLDQVGKGVGNSENNRITGNDTDNELDGGWGDDTLIGGNGSDLYTVDSQGDVVVELAGQGFDTVLSSATYTLPSNVESLYLLGHGNNGTGNGSNNHISGNEGDNVLKGGAGIDTVSYWGAARSVTVNLSVTSQQSTGWGSDTLSGFENVTGSDHADRLTGDANANVILGEWGNDTMAGGLGNDTYEVDDLGDVVIEAAGGGIDRVMSLVDYTLGSNVESLTLMESTSAVFGTGNDAANDIVGNSFSNVLDGRGGADTLTGGGGSDIYIVDNVGDKVVESLLGYDGWATVNASVSYTIPDGVEDLKLTGSAAINGTGNSMSNTLTGNAAANVLDGGSGDDTMIGGAGNDTYWVDSGFDVVTEAAGGGIDLIKSYLDAVLQDHVENLSLMGNAATDGMGNSLANLITGNSAGNQLFSFEGADTLNGGSGADAMYGGTGNDTYIVDNVGDRAMEEAGAGTDLVQSSISFTLQAEVEKLTLTGSSAINGTGNALANTITGNSAANALNGASGADSMTGGAGNDTYVVDNSGDKTIEIAAGGTDLVRSSVNFTLQAEVENLTLSGSSAINGTGNSLANAITGNSAANVLNGASGADSMTGGAGNDTYVVDNSGDKTIEVAAGGTDLVQSSISFTLQAEVEKLTLTGSSAINGTGNSLANTITGNSAANLLNGASGADSMTGGAGNDTYVVDNTGDKTIEIAAGGTDLVQSSVSFTLQAEVENLTLTGSSAINGTGNSLANTITGNAANNILNGSTGADSMTGGAGNDTYVVDNTGDKIIEVAAGGNDLVQSSVSFTLQAEVEKLTLTGSSAINGTGNSLANALTGNSAANVLSGGGGSDTLTGGSGADIFALTSSLGSDLITDFVSRTDKLRVGQTGLRVGDGDLLIEGAATISGPNGFASTAELVIVTHDIAGALTTTSAATAIGRANSAYQAGDTRLFVVDNGSDSAVYLFKSANTDSVVSASELTLLATLDNTASTVATDYLFGP
jgi:Ca2+-binding RTX toxin-like protein